MFYDNELIFTLLLTLSNVYSNKLISIEQIKDFITLYKLDERFLNCVLVNHEMSLQINLANHQQEVFPLNTIGLKEFKQLCYVDPSFVKVITSMKNSLQVLCFTIDEYRKIQKRFTYYYMNPETACDRCTILSNTNEKIPELSDVDSLNKKRKLYHNNKVRDSSSINSSNYNHNYDEDTDLILNCDIPEESCWSKFDRKYFHYKLPPYYYDYGINHPNFKSLEEVVLMARKMYGYSVRINRNEAYNTTKNVIVCDIFDNNKK